VAASGSSSSAASELASDWDVEALTIMEMGSWAA